MHCILRRPTPRQSFSALTETISPILKSIHIYRLLSCTADTFRYTVTLTSDLWPSYRLWRGQTLYHIWAKASNRQRSYCDITIWSHDWRMCHVLCSAPRLFYQVWTRSTPPFTFLLLIRYLTLWLWPLTAWTWTCVKPFLTSSCRTYRLSRDQTLPQIRAKSFTKFKSEVFCSFTRVLQWTNLSRQQGQKDMTNIKRVTFILKFSVRKFTGTGIINTLFTN